MERSDLHLAQKALPVVGAIAAALAVEIPSRPLSEFGARLTLFSEWLPELKVRLNDKQRLDELLCKVLQIVEQACTWPEGNNISSMATLKSLAELEESRKSCYSFATWFLAGTSHDRVRECLKRYVWSTAEFMAMLSKIKDTIAVGEESLGQLGQEEEEEEEEEEAPEYLVQVNRDLHDVLRCYISDCKCDGQHLARLRLSPRDHVQQRGAVCFELLFCARVRQTHGCSSNETHWKETTMLVPSQDAEENRTAFSSINANLDPVIQSLPEDNSVVVDQGHFCASLDCRQGETSCFLVKHSRLRSTRKKLDLERWVKAEEGIALSEAFKTHTMSMRTRCILAYTLARSVWQFFGSKWMKTPWTRDNIHLLDDELVLEDMNPASSLFRSYFLADFQEDQRDISEFIRGGMFCHRYPQILTLGILLIEIAKGKPFEVPNIPFDYSCRSINRYLMHATEAVEDVGHFGKKRKDFGSSRMAVESCLQFDSYRMAVENCLQFGELFNMPWIVGQAKCGGEDRSLEERRAAIYWKIVLPLEGLLKGTEWLAWVDQMEHHLDPVPTMRDTPTLSETKLAQSIHNSESKTDPGSLNCHPCLLNGKTRMTSASWITELVSIAEICAQSDASNSVRIAVIDTGCDLEKPIFKLQGYEDRLRGHWRDWVDRSPKPQDKHGHGTEIVSLLLRILPNAEIFVARVAKNEQDLDTADGLIVKAIDHAATEWLADIITMSFGFSHEKQSIKRAIRKAEEDRDESIIFFAAAANEGSNTKELFPANLYPVIPIRGTDCAGAFVPLYDPDVSRIRHGMQLYGTLGEDVPWGWPDERRVSSGCSIATPIAAGIAALVIQCVSSKQNPFDQEDRRKIRTRRAILEVFHEISIEKATNRRYINPRNLVDKTNRPNVAMIRHVLSRIP